uniref:Predicted protein n=1 Tax=Hordeum vulgare subsp. vulgare TaxID=112509 RepID=F2DPC2_HORVV|nr:predicted protein [Hordeum vulgare subsp. vulgare]
MVQAQYQIEILKYTFLVWFWMNFGWVYTGGRGDDHVVDHSPLWAIILSLLFIFLPLFVHSLFKDSRSLKNYNRFMDAFTVSYVIQILLSILVMIFFVIMSENGLCTLHGTQKEAHMLTFRSHHHDQTFFCTNIPIVLTGSTSLITFVVFQGEEFYNSSF